MNELFYVNTHLDISRKCSTGCHLKKITQIASSTVYLQKAGHHNPLRRQARAHDRDLYFPPLTMGAPSILCAQHGGMDVHPGHMLLAF
jgi:hypothetical protein